ncbi:Lipolytic enzyme [Mycena indigotica]|uniref:Lipolytic enzyme n=1 Tax=Mycena indigotica TaxID=2126181 RepID=A0A8H6VUP8_9AGAR|nr:Lipolytic enzyme [Mycena indigotica]KAF7290778.1 Lipolytic enzyme [Mycena indigotica]
MVGSQQGGTFYDPFNEGYPGAIISQVDDKAKVQMPIQRPSVVTILVGTNDMTGNVDVANAPNRLKTLIQNVLDAPPLTLVIVSTLPPNANSDANIRINAYNAALSGVVQSFVDAGRSVVLVDCHAVVALSDLVDGTHPNDAAFARMAKVFYQGFQDASARGWIFDVDGAEPIDGFTGKPLRIMPLGASITYGTGSSDGNGYRATLYNLLARDGNNVNLVGSQKGGNFSDPWNEGYPGLNIAQVDAKAQVQMSIRRPGVVTLLVGTVDAQNNIDPDNAPARLKTLIQNVLDAPPLTLVVVSTLLPNSNSAANTRINAYNAALPSVVKSFTDAGRSVVLVDCHSVVAVSDLVDGTNPNDAAYARMAKVFYGGLQQAAPKGWIFALDGADPVNLFT